MYFTRKKNFLKRSIGLRKTVEYDPGYDLAWNILGLSQTKVNDLTDAVNSFENAIKSSNKNDRKGSNYYRLGDTLLKLKKYKEAESAFLSALKFSKSQSIVGGSNFGLGDVYKHLGQKSKAIEYYKKASKNRSWKASADYEIDMLQNPDKYVKYNLS